MIHGYTMPCSYLLSDWNHKQIPNSTDIVPKQRSIPQHSQPSQNRTSDGIQRTESWHQPANWIKYPGLNFTYGSRPSFCTKVSKFLTSAIIKWWFSTSRGLRKMTTWHCYKMKIGFYHEVTWRGNSTTTKWRLVFIIKLLAGDTPPLQNEDGFLYVFIIRLLEGNTSEGQLPLLQNEIGFLHVVFRWANSLATKWLSIFKRSFNYRNVDNL